MLIRTLSTLECTKVLAANRLAHLACCKDGRPYVVPIYYAYADYHLYVFSMPGKKINWMRDNPMISLQVDERGKGRGWHNRRRPLSGTAGSDSLQARARPCMARAQQAFRLVGAGRPQTGDTCAGEPLASLVFPDHHRTAFGTRSEGERRAELTVSSVPQGNIRPKPIDAAPRYAWRLFTAVCRSLMRPASRRAKVRLLRS